MDKPSVFEIRITGQISGQWSDWFSGMEIRTSDIDETILRGYLSDQAELIGVLNRLNALNLMIISVKEE